MFWALMVVAGENRSVHLRRREELTLVWVAAGVAKPVATMLAWVATAVEVVAVVKVSVIVPATKASMPTAEVAHHSKHSTKVSVMPAIIALVQWAAIKV